MRRQYPVYNPWPEMERFQLEMNRLFNQAYRPDRQVEFPAINVWTNEEGQFITAELPGVSIEDLEIIHSKDTLTIKASRNPENIPENARYLRQERACGEFSKSIQLNFPIDEENVEAKLNNGVLTVFLPKAEEIKPRKIEIKTV
jgi:HSP20 family protein